MVSPGFTLVTWFTAGNRLNTECALRTVKKLRCPAAFDAKDTGNKWEGEASDIKGGTPGRAADFRGCFMK